MENTIPGRLIAFCLLSVLPAVLPVPVRAQVYRALTPEPAQAHSPEGRVWECWQTELQSSRDYGNPYKDVRITVEYTGPGKERFTAQGFWNGGRVFLIRTAFPSEGLWHWRTSCSDTLNGGLHNRSGTVLVKPYRGSNPLYGKGFLRVNGNGRYLVYDNGDPFLWVGTTAWVAPLRASFADWKLFIDDCARKKFTVVQLSPASRWSGDSTDVNGNPPFTGPGLDQWNPAYWDGFDEKVQYANEKGIVVLVVGLMEPVGRYPSEEDATAFARNLAARMSGNFVIFSPSFDSPFKELGNVVGEVVKETSSRHLVTQHPNTPYHPAIHTTADRYYDEDYLDFSLCQSGHNGGNRNWCVWKAIHWNLALYRRGTKPVINAEAYYETDTAQAAEREPKYRGTATDARQLGYMSFLSGALGYTYGALGLWNWETDTTKPSYWKRAMQLPGSVQMTYLHDLFSAIRWWDLEPAHDLVLNQAPDTLSTMTLARSPEHDLLVAYLPRGGAIRINLEKFTFPAQMSWFDPRSGRYAGQKVIRNKEENEFISPGWEESLLLLTTIKQ